MYYFKYEGWAPAIFTKKADCTFLNTNDLSKAMLGVWFRPNPFGGYCGFLVMVGVDEEEASPAEVTVVRQFDSAVKLVSAVSLVFSYFLL